MADETKLTAATRLEKLLDNIAGGENEVTPATRLEKFLSYIADAMEGGGGEDADYVKVLNATDVDMSDHTDAPIYVYTNQDAWVNLRDNGYLGIYNTEEDIPEAYVVKDVNGVAFPLAIFSLPGYVTSASHTPGSYDPSGYYIEYADQYSAIVLGSNTLIMLKNGVVNYHSGVA